MSIINDLENEFNVLRANTNVEAKIEAVAAIIDRLVREVEALVGKKPAPKKATPKESSTE